MTDQNNTEWDRELRALEHAPLERGNDGLRRAQAVLAGVAVAMPGSGLHARAHAALGRFLATLGRLDEAVAEGRTAVRLLRPLGDTHSLALALNVLGAACTQAGDYPAALTVLEEAVWVARRGDAALLARLRNSLAICLHDMGRYADAIALYDEARASIDAQAHRRLWLLLTGNRAHALLMQGFRAQDAGDAAQARLLAERADDTAEVELAHWRALGESASLAGCLDNRAGAALLRGDCAGAHALLDEAEQLLALDPAAAVFGSVFLAMTRARAFMAEGSPKQAVALLQSLVARHDAIGRRTKADELHRLLSMAQEAAGDMAAALAAFKRHHDEHARMVQAHAEERARVLAVKLQTDRLAQESRQDPLTGLANRRRLDEYLAGMLPRASATEPLCLVLIDLDDFKPINDRHGHQVGDAALRWVARHLQAHCRQTDLPARLGGDEFALAMAAPVAVAERVCARLREAVSRPAPELPPGLAVAFSAGVARSDGLDDARELIARADQALYSAKAAGRNVVRVAA